MGLPKKKSRKIIVDNIAYRWLASGKADGIDIYVELYEQPASLLRSRVKYDSGGRQQIAVTPASIELLIRDAVSRGWSAHLTGPDFMGYFPITSTKEVM